MQQFITQIGRENGGREAGQLTRSCALNSFTPLLQEMPTVVTDGSQRLIFAIQFPADDRSCLSMCLAKLKVVKHIAQVQNCGTLSIKNETMAIREFR